MLRRDFLVASAAVLGSVPRRALATDGPPLQVKRSFNLCRPGEAKAMLTRTRIHDGMIYYLEQNMTAPRRHTVGCADSSGKLQWSWDLPKGVFSALEVRPSGSIVVEKVGIGLEEYREDGHKVRSIPLEAGNQSSCLVGDLLVRYLRNGLVEILDMRSDAPEVRHMSVPLRADQSIRVEALDDHRALFVDIELARMAVLDLRTGSAAAGLVDSPEMSGSLAQYAKLRDEASRDGDTLRTVSLLATGVDGSGAFYCFVSPYRVEDALILKTSDKGSVLQKIRCAMPPRNTAGFGVPSQLLALGSQLMAVFFQGGVLRYDLT